MIRPGALLGGRYRLEARLGSGGMAEVYRGRDLRLGRPVAVKILRDDLAEDATFRRRFQREAQNSAALNHPAIVAVHDTGDERRPTGAHVLFIVMELVDGQTLRRTLSAAGALDVRHAVRLAAEVCAALEYSHQHGIVHRDIKPGNIMITGSGQIKIMDFGIALALSGSSVTPTGAVVGTAFYLSPEQANGAAIDARSDVYAIGCLLYELLCGKPPFICDNPIAVAYRHLTEAPRPPCDRRSEVPPELSSIVLRALAKDPDARPQSAEKLRQDLVGFIEGRLPAGAGDLPAVGHPAGLLPLPAGFPGSTAVLSRAELDNLLASLRADRERLSGTLYTIEAHPGADYLSDADLRGETLTAREHLYPLIQRLWMAFTVLSEVLDRAGAVRERRSRPGRVELIELTWILRGRAVALAAEHDPEPARGNTTLTVAALISRINRGCADTIAMLDRLASAGADLADRSRVLSAALDRARAAAVELHYPESTALEQLAMALAQAGQDALSDPLGGDLALDDLTTSLAGHEKRLATLDSIRQAVSGRVLALGRLLDQVNAAERTAASRHEAAHIKIVNPELGPLPNAIGGLRARLTELTDRLEDSSQWSLVAGLLTDLERDAADAFQAALAAELLASALLAKRDELRGRITAYRARAIRLGRGEDADLAERYRQARDLLWHAPCDLPTAALAVLRYQRGVRGEEEPT